MSTTLVPNVGLILIILFLVNYFLPLIKPKKIQFVLLILFIEIICGVFILILYEKILGLYYGRVELIPSSRFGLTILDSCLILVFIHSTIYLIKLKPNRNDSM
jgi:hypothetical protein